MNKLISKSSLSPLITMKRQQQQQPHPPTTPPQTHLQSNPKPDNNLNFTKSKKPRKRSILFSNDTIPTTFKWVPLDIPKSELYLPLTFPTGQTFRWKQTGPLQFTGPIGSNLFSLKHSINGGPLFYCLHNPGKMIKIEAFSTKKGPLSTLLDFLNVGISLKDLWEGFSMSDTRFAELAVHLGGARVLRQDPVECLIQFLCSSNNNIGRITKMVDFVSSLGDYLGNVEGFDFYEFPSLERLALVSEKELRVAGFGYRAKYIVGTINFLKLKPVGGAEWLASLRNSELQEVIDALRTLPGVGPKVAACIALFSLDQHHAIPVDTHVWKIATKYLMPELAGASLTPKLHSCVADAFVSKYGKYAGWAQTLLFIAELPSQKLLLPSHLRTNKENKKAN